MRNLMTGKAIKTIADLNSSSDVLTCAFNELCDEVYNLIDTGKQDKKLVYRSLVLTQGSIRREIAELKGKDEAGEKCDPTNSS